MIVKFEFWFLEIDAWENHDDVSLVINDDILVNMGKLNKNDDGENDRYESEKDGIQLYREIFTDSSNVAFSKFGVPPVELQEFINISLS